MTGDRTTPESLPRAQRAPGRPDHGRDPSDPGNAQKNRNRRSGGGGGGGARRGAYRFEDGLEHDICQQVTHRPPQGFPVIGRPELATMPPTEVERTESRILFCDCRHEGPHIWPNGDEAG